MFNKPIHSTKLTGETADRLFGNITVSGMPDLTFSATVRALFHGRLPANKSAHLLCKPLYFSEQQIASATPKQAMNWFVPEISSADYSLVIVYTSTYAAGVKMLETVKANAKRYMPEFALQEDLRVFYARKLNALFYHNPNENRTIIFTDKLELKHFHALQMMIPKYFPSLFFDNPLTDLEANLLKSLGNKLAAEYENLIAEITNKLDIRAEIIRIKLAGFENAFEKIRISELKSEIKSEQQNYDTYLQKLQAIANIIQEKQYTLAGLECSVNQCSGDSELVEYFMCNKNISIINVRGTSIELVVHGYADVYDQEAFDRYVKNHSSFLYSNLHSQFTKSQMEKLYRAIFEKCTHKLRICAAYTADLKSGLSAYKNYVFPSESKDYLPNPHIQNHGCIGTYSARFQDYLSNKDYVGAIDQAVVSARNLNFYDSTVMSGFARDLSHSAIKCIENPNGILLTPREAIAELGGEN